MSYQFLVKAWCMGLLHSTAMCVSVAFFQTRWIFCPVPGRFAGILVLHCSINSLGITVLLGCQALRA